MEHSGRAPPSISSTVKLLLTAVVFLSLSAISEAFGLDNQTILNLTQPLIDPSVAGNQFAANVVKGGAGALLQGLTPLVAALTTIIIGGVTCALLKSRNLTLTTSLISLTRLLSRRKEKLATITLGFFY